MSATAADPPLVASPEQITRALSVASCAGQYDLIDDREREALDALLVDGAPLATVRAVVGDLLLLAPHDSALEHHATRYLKETPPTRGGVLCALIEEHGRALGLIAAPERGMLATRTRVTEARARVAKAVEVGLFSESEGVQLAEWIDGWVVEVKSVESVEKRIRDRAAARKQVLPW
jgi:hypothetical protein